MVIPPRFHSPSPTSSQPTPPTYSTKGKEGTRFGGGKSFGLGNRILGLGSSQLLSSLNDPSVTGVVYLVTILVARAEYPVSRDLSGRRAFLVHGLVREVQSIKVGKARRQENEAAQQEMEAGTLLIFFLLSPRSQPTGWRRPLEGNAHRMAPPTGTAHSVVPPTEWCCPQDGATHRVGLPRSLKCL